MSDTTDRIARWARALATPAQFGKFVSVGAVGAVCDTLVLLVLVEGVGVQAELAALVGIEVSILVMFALNEGWTFRRAGGGGWLATTRRLVRSHAVRAGGTLTQFLLFVTVYRLLFVDITAVGLDVWLLVAKGTGILAGLGLNYVFEVLFTWRVQDR